MNCSYYSYCVHYLSLISFCCLVGLLRPLLTICCLYLYLSFCAMFPMKLDGSRSLDDCLLKDSQCLSNNSTSWLFTQTVQNLMGKDSVSKLIFERELGFQLKVLWPNASYATENFYFSVPQSISVFTKYVHRMLKYFLIWVSTKNSILIIELDKLCWVLQTHLDVNWRSIQMVLSGLGPGWPL